MNALAQVEAARLSRLLNGIQETMDWRGRTPIADALSGLTRSMIPPGEPLPPETLEKAERLKRDGLYRLGRLLAPEQVAEIHAYLKTRPCYTGHVPAQGDGVPRTPEECAKLSNCGSYQRADVLGAPHLLELANRPELLGIAEAYLGCAPTIYSINLFWSFPERGEKYPATQLYHRDFDDFRFCTMFIFMTDIKGSDGAHYFMRGTHRAAYVEQAYNERLRDKSMFPLDRLFLVAAYDDRDCQNLFAGDVETVTGPAGHGVFEDTYGLHKGDVPQTPRLLGWVRYGLYDNLTAHKDNPAGPSPRAVGAGRIPPGPRHAFMNRLLIEP